MRVLVDNSVLHHSVEHQSAWLDIGVERWGGNNGININTGRLASRNIPIMIKDTKGGQQSKYIAALALAHIKGEWEAHTTDALDLERLGQPSNKFLGIGYASFSWFGKIKRVSNSTLSGFSCIFPSELTPNERFREFLASQADSEYLEIRNHLFEVNRSDKSNQDAWHLFCVGLLKLDYLLTCDTALLGQIKSIRNQQFRKRLLKTVLLPKNLCELMGLEGATESDFSYLLNFLGGWR